MRKGKTVADEAPGGAAKAISSAAAVAVETGRDALSNHY